MIVIDPLLASRICVAMHVKYIYILTHARDMRMVCNMIINDLYSEVPSIDLLFKIALIKI